MRMNETIAKRVQKLLNLSSSSNESEARAALLKAQELMAQHNISMRDVNGVSVVQEENVSEVDLDNGRTRLPAWQKGLVNVIAKNFRCGIYMQRYARNRRKFVLYGMESDVQTAKEVIEFALKSAENCWLKYKRRRERIDGPSPSRAVTERIKNDYFLSFTKGVSEAFKAQVEEKGIVLAQDAKVKRFVAEQNFRQESSRINTLGDSHAQQSGYQDGRRIRGGSRLSNRQRFLTGPA